MTTRSRIVLIGSVGILVVAFFVLWVRSFVRSWNEVRVMPLLGDEEQDRYKQVVDEASNAIGNISETWQRVSEPPRVEVPASTDTLPEGAAERIQQVLQNEVTSTNR